MGNAVGIELGHERGRGAQADGETASVVVDVVAAVGLDEEGAVLVGENAIGQGSAVTGFVSSLGRAEPYLVRGTPYGAEALVAQLLRHVADLAGSSSAVATALVHEDGWGEYQLDLVREAVRLAAVGPVLLVAADVACSYDDDLAVGAARWAWEQQRDGDAGGMVAPGSPVSARTVLLGVGAGSALALGGGAVAAGAAGGAGATGASLGDFSGSGGSTLGDFAGQQGGSSLGDFAGQQGGSTIGDFAGQQGGSRLSDFASQQSGSRLGDFAAPASPTPAPPGATKVAKTAKRSLKVPAAVGAAVVAVGVIAGVALASTSADDDRPDDEQAGATTTTEAEEPASTSITAGATTTPRAGSARLSTPFLLACGGEGPAGAGSGGPAIEASCGRPLDLAIADDGTIYFTDRQLRGTAISTVRAVLPDGTLRSFDLGEVDGERVATPSAVAVADDGTLFVADLDNNRILRRLPNGVVSRYAGASDGSMAGDAGAGRPIPVGDGVPAASSAIGNVGSMALDDAGNLYFTDHHNDIVQRIDVDGTLTTVGPDRLTSLLQGGPVAVERDPAGQIHVAGTHSIWRLDGDTFTPVAANGERPAEGDDQTGKDAMEAELWIEDIAFAPDGTLYVAEISDRANVWRIPTAGTVTRALGGEVSRTLEGPSATRIQPSGIAIDDEGRIVLTETGNGYEMVRRFPAPR